MLKLLKLFLLGLCASMLASQSASGAVIPVEMKGIQFVPRNLTVNAGDTVTWVNRDSTLHDTVSGVNRVPNGVWRSSLFGLGGSFSFTFTNAGTFPYYCTPHALPPFTMIGTITVLPVNAPPTISLTTPTNNATFPAGATILIEASATDDNGVARVEFFSNGTLFATDFEAPYSAPLTNVGAGNHVLFAKAIDTHGLSATSAPVNISVLEPLVAPTILSQPLNKTVPSGTDVTFAVAANGTQPLRFQWQFNSADITGATADSLSLTNVQTNHAGSYVVLVRNEAGSTQSAPAVLIVTNIVTNIFPTIHLTTPTNGARFRAGSTVFVQADASDENGSIALVEFFLNGIPVGTSTHAPYEFAITNLAAGNYSLSGRAEDDEGASTLSETVTISVLEPPSIAILHPGDRETFLFGTNLLLVAEVIAPEIAATSVQFFEETDDGLESISPPLAAPHYEFLWKPLVPGMHRLRAVVNDALGGSNASSRVSVFLNAGTELPTIAITNAPPDGARLTNASVMVAGSANDDLFLDRVIFQVNGGPFFLATGASNWTAVVNLFRGTNVIEFYSLDLAGNVSASPATRTFVFEQSAITVRINHPERGRVSPNLNGQLLELGRIYQMVARPGAGFIFGGWSGGVSSNSAVLNFTMQPDLDLTANFVTNPFPGLKGDYAGLFAETNGVRPESSGAFKIIVTGRGTFSGRLIVQNKSYPMHGRLDHAGAIRFPILRRPTTNLVVSLKIDLEGMNGVTGFVESGWTSVLMGIRAVAVSEWNPELRGEQLPFDFALGQEKVGVGRVRIGNGVKVRGEFFEQKFSKTLQLSATGVAPFYFAWQDGDSVLIGWLHLPGGWDGLLEGELTLGTSDVSSPINILPAP